MQIEIKSHFLNTCFVWAYMHISSVRDDDDASVEEELLEGLKVLSCALRARKSLTRLLKVMVYNRNNVRTKYTNLGLHLTARHIIFIMNPSSFSKSILNSCPNR